MWWSSRFIGTGVGSCLTLPSPSYPFQNFLLFKGLQHYHDNLAGSCSHSISCCSGSFLSIHMTPQNRPHWSFGALGDHKVIIIVHHMNDGPRYIEDTGKLLYLNDGVNLDITSLHKLSSNGTAPSVLMSDVNLSSRNRQFLELLVSAWLGKCILGITCTVCMISLTGHPLWVESYKYYYCFGMSYPFC